MGNLKKENVTKCFSLLKEFIDESGTTGDKKGIAVLALDQLRHITAGSNYNSSDLRSPCLSKPLMY